VVDDLIALGARRYVGADQDGTGLYKMGARYYEPALGRFTQQDPIVDLLNPKQWNRYVYVGDDPVNFVDPTGTFSLCKNSWINGAIDYTSVLPGNERNFPRSLSLGGWAFFKWWGRLTEVFSPKVFTYVKVVTKVSFWATVVGTFADVARDIFC
jgi:RHS repeat-associated protein